ncbi:MAG: hypothetical protein AAF790_10860 [Planctomycetota bacterium]
MAALNRADKIKKLVASLKKHYKPAPPAAEQPLFECLLLACLLEDSPREAAQKAFETLQTQYFDWNEVRVSTRRELAEAMKGLTDPDRAADRLRTTLQSVFETFYQFSLEPMKKQNLGVSIKQLEKLPGVTPFAVAYVVQNALGGHSIPVNRGLLLALRTIEVITDAEAAAGTVPGLERAVPKNKGVEVGSLLHQLGVEVGKNPYGPAARQRLLSLDPGCKDRLPKRPPKPKPEPEPKQKPPTAKAPPVKPAAAQAKPGAAQAKPAEGKAKPAPAPPPKTPAPAKPASGKAAAAKSKPAAKPVKKPAPAAKKPAPAKKAVKKKVLKKVAKKKAATKAPVKKKVVKKPATKKVAKKAAKKPAAAKKKTGAAKRKPR